MTVIAIGGNTLSRGLTLEGLVCNYFERQSRNYDTLMQMGRWFGSATDTATSRGFGPPSFFTGSESSMLSRTSSGLNLSG